MSMFLKTILFSIIFLYKSIKSQDYVEISDSLRFLNDNKSLRKYSTYSNSQNESEEYNLIDRVKKLNYIDFLSSFGKEENKDFNVRCFWVDLETLRVYDLIKLKTKK